MLYFRIIFTKIIFILKRVVLIFLSILCMGFFCSSLLFLFVLFFLSPFPIESIIAVNFTNMSFSNLSSFRCYSLADLFNYVYCFQRHQYPVFFFQVFPNSFTNFSPSLFVIIKAACI